MHVDGHVYSPMFCLVTMYYAYAYVCCQECVVMNGDRRPSRGFIGSATCGNVTHVLQPCMIGLMPNQPLAHVVLINEDMGRCASALLP